MKAGRWKFGIGILLLVGTLTGQGAVVHSDGGKQISEPKPGPGKVFLYTAKKFGVPFLRASIKIENGSSEQGKPVCHIYASVDSYHSYGFLFRMNNRFSATMQAETCSPIRYVKEIDQQGLLVENKNYSQTFTFDFPNKRLVVEKGKKERQEVSLSSETYDPLSMFARCYLKEEIHPGQNILMPIFDGAKLRQMLFYSKKGRVTSKMYGEVEAVCLNSSTSFSSFGDKEGNIRIWYTANGEKIPILIELELPIGNIKFELESIEGS